MTIPARFVNMRPLQNGKCRVVIDVAQDNVPELADLIGQQCFITLGAGAKIEVLPPARQKVAAAPKPTPLEEAIASAPKDITVAGVSKEIEADDLVPPTRMMQAIADSGTPVPEVKRGSPFAGVV